jgi:segregation and condensation protein B
VVHIRQPGNRSSLLQVTDKFNRTYEINDLVIQQLALPLAAPISDDDIPTIAEPQVDLTTESDLAADN